MLRGGLVIWWFDILTGKPFQEKEGSMSGVDPRSCRVALLAGGKSNEREISLSSGDGAREALLTAGFEVVDIDPANPDDLKRLIEEHFDVAFLCLHGKYGEDGTVQGLLDIVGLPYTCSGVWSSALAMDKPKAKVFYERAGVATPPSMTVYKGHPIEASDVVEKLGNHVVVKPGTEGSAIGVFIVEGEKDIAGALEKALEIDDEVLIERYIKGRELTVAVLGNDDAEALPIIEIIPKSAFYDFESKYAADGSKHVCPAEIPEDIATRVKAEAVKAHKALSCSGTSRSDFILEEDGSCWCLETNTIPGMTATSLLPDAARAAGMSFPELCTKLIELALENHTW